MNKEIDILSRLRKISELDDVLWIAKVREIILSIHENEKIKLCEKFEPFEVMRTLSDCMDLVVKEIYIRKVGHEVSGISVIAVGGFGRREMSFYSDVDLMFLMGKSYDPGSDHISGILHLLWDFHLDIGYSSRTISEAIKIAKNDVESCTAMMDGRLLIGDEKVFSDFRKKLNSNRPRGLPEKLNSWRSQRTANNASVQLLEPNVKESPGALRDIQVLQWAIMSKADLDAVEDRWGDLLDQKDTKALEEAWKFLSAIRLHLHADFGRKRDILDADAKINVAKALGYKDNKVERGVELFMRDYYQNARSVFHLANLTFEKLTRKRRVSVKTMYIEHGLISIDNEVIIKDGRIYFSNNPHRILSIFLILQRKNLVLGEAAKREIQRSLEIIDDEFRRSVEARDLFFKILSGKARIASTIRLMHEVGVLDVYLPEFGGLNCLGQFNPYHIYTVDEHTLIAIKNLEALLQERREKKLSNIFINFKPKSILFFSVLMHDIGKCNRTDHISAGVRMARSLSERLSFTEYERELFIFLIRKHQEMVLISRRRDLEDDEMITEFSKEFESKEYLDGLYLVSYADLSAVSAEAWTEWQAALLWELYDKTAMKLESTKIREEKEMSPYTVFEKHVDELKESYSFQEISMLKDHVEKMPEKYPANYQFDEIQTHVRMIQDLNENRIYVLDFIEREDYTEIVICTRDRRQVLAKLCGALAVNDLNILRADIITTSDQIVLDTFQVINIDGGLKLDEWKKQRVTDRLTDVLDKGKKARDLLESHSGNWSRRSRAEYFDETKVEIDNQSSRNYTVLDVDARDDVGLLYRITHALTELDLDIHMALIDTVVGRASDAFYVIDRAGKKIQDENMTAMIRQRLFYEIG